MRTGSLRNFAYMRYVLRMFLELRLTHAFKHLMNAHDWSWFGPIVAPGTYHCDDQGWPLYTHRELQVYDEMWLHVAYRTREKLKAGKWVAAGISHPNGLGRAPIDVVLWDYLHIVVGTEEAAGSGFRFLALTVSDVQPSKAVVSQRQTGVLRSQLTSWIRQNVKGIQAPQLRADQLKAARDAFEGCDITENMFRDCRRAAGLPESAVQNGRPKAKGLDKS
jgi:hypothetical protein